MKFPTFSVALFKFFDYFGAVRKNCKIFNEPQAQGPVKFKVKKQRLIMDFWRIFLDVGEDRPHLWHKLG